MTSTRLVLATGNPGKLREMRSLLSNTAWEIAPQSEFNCPDAVEDGLSFVENAIIKARHASAFTGLAAIADDSGLEVDHLSGAPGIYSARYAGEHANDAANIDKLLLALNDIPRAGRGARFRCVVVYMRHQHDPSPLICEGSWEGSIGTRKQGDNGFGYDPVFIPAGHEISSAQLSAAQKNAMSHRGQALKLLAGKLK